MATGCRERQADLAKLARNGDEAAATELYLSVLPWVKRKSWDYAQRWGCCADDLEAEAWSRFMLAIKYYTPTKGGFVNYFASVASRSMCELCRKEGARPEVSATDLPELDAPEPDIDRDYLAAVDMLLQLPPIQQHIVCCRLGIDGPTRGMNTISNELGLSHFRVQELYHRAIYQMRMGVEQSA